MQASLRSLRLRESDRAPANAGARLRLRVEVRRSRVAQAGLVVSVGIGATRLRRPQSVTPPRDGLRPRSGTVPPVWGPRPLPWRRAPALRPPFQGPRPLPWSCALRSRACAPARAFRPRSGVVPPLSGRAMRKTVGFGRWRSKQTVFRGLGSGKRTFLSVVRVWAFR